MNHSVSLWDEDEAAYAGFGQQMLATGDWLIPEFEWSRIHRKTPFHFWTVATSFSIFGVNEFALRLPSTLAVFLTCFLVFYWGRFIFGEPKARVAAIVLASSIVLPVIGKVALTDAHLLLFQTSAVLALFNYLQNPNWKWNLAFWLSIALGILTKGPPILILTGGLWLWLAFWHPKRKVLIGTHPWIFGFMALVPAVYWGYLTYLEDGGVFLAFLYDWYVYRRISGDIYNQTGPPGYHLLVLMVAFLSWLPFVLSSIWETLKAFGKKDERDEENILLVGWLVFSWFFYELMTSKLPSYSLAAQPALAILIAKQVLVFENGNGFKFPKLSWGGALLYTILLGALAIALPIIVYSYFGEEFLLHSLLFTGLVGFTLIKTLSALYQQAGNAMSYMALTGMTLLLGINLSVLPILEQTPLKSLEQVATTAGEYQKAATDIPVYLVGFGPKQQKISLYFYLSQYFEDRQILTPQTAANYYQNKEKGVFLLASSGYAEFKYACERLGIGKEQWQAKGKEVMWRSMDDKLAAHPFWIFCSPE
ncbi:MAG: glycosyltransferase family 39 protein [Saprospiraceae bacterium]|nr:glycosyltransferase family 39 protein [Saprospiraceae bacterium]